MHTFVTLSCMYIFYQKTTDMSNWAMIIFNYDDTGMCKNLGRTVIDKNKYMYTISCT